MTGALVLSLERYLMFHSYLAHPTLCLLFASKNSGADTVDLLYNRMDSPKVIHLTKLAEGDPLPGRRTTYCPLAKKRIGSALVC
jgi:hypothetical protein